MRTMLISLILICSLAQLASAGASPTESGGCESLYTCLVPQKCKIGSTKSFVDSELEIYGDPDILNDCDAIIRYHRADKTKTYVSIESFQDTVTKIVVEQKHLSSGKTVNLFTCEKDVAAGKIKGTFFDEVKMEKDISPGNLLCIFDVKKDPNTDGTYFSQGDRTTISTYHLNANPSTTKPTKITNDLKVRCDPSIFEFNEPKNQNDKIYKEVSLRNYPYKYECEDGPLFKMEFKNKDKYEFVNKIECSKDSAQFLVYPEVAPSTGQDHIEIDVDEFIEIRCVAETKFMCKYSPKVKDGEDGPKLEVKPEGNSLKCPPNKPYFFIGQSAKYLTNPVFTCTPFRTTALWTIDLKTTFAKDNPTVYCTDKRNCTKPISASAVEGGTLGTKAMPTCFNEGTLKTADGKLAGNFSCDYSIGEYKYTAGGEEMQITPSTKFICEYPQPPDPPMIDKATGDKIQTAIFVAIGVSALVVAGTCVGSCLLMKQKMKKKRKELKARQAFNNQWLTKHEKALLAEKEKKNPPKSGEKSKPDEKIVDEQKAPGKLTQFQNMAYMKGSKMTLKDRKQHNDSNKGFMQNKKTFLPHAAKPHFEKKIGKSVSEKDPLRNHDEKKVVKMGTKMIKDRASGKIQKDEN